MHAISSSSTSETHSAVLAVVVGGLVAGTLDITQACILFGWNTPLAIAGGLIGPSAFKGGVATYMLGLGLHFFIALAFAAAFYVASRQLRFMTVYPLICGLIYGAMVEEIMNLIVLPLSALRLRGPYTLHDLLQGLLVHMVVLGLPIAYSVRRFAD